MELTGWEEVATPDDMLHASDWIYTNLIDNGTCPYQSNAYHAAYNAMFECREIAEKMLKNHTEEIVHRLELSGEWGNGYGASECEFIVDGKIPETCPSCGKLLETGENLDSCDSAIEVWMSCNDCGLTWYAGSYPAM